MKQKITIKVDMNGQKSHVKTMQIAATTPRVTTVSIKDDTVTVEGNDVDSVALTSKLRRKVGYAILIGVEEVKEKKKDDGGGKDKKEAGAGGDKKAPQPTTYQYHHQYPYVAFPPPPVYDYGYYNQAHGVPVSESDESSCSVM